MDEQSLGEILREILDKLGVSNPNLSCEEASKQLAFMKNAELNSLPGTLDKSDGYDCPLCQNRGIVYEARLADANWTVVGVSCNCQTARRSFRRLRASGLEPVVNRFTFDTFETNEPWRQTLKDAAVRYSERPNGAWLFLGGATGAGKTHLCTAAAIKLLKQGLDVRYMLWRDTAAKAKALVNEAAEYAAVIQPLKDCGVLYIDDFFKTGTTDGLQKPTAADVNLAFEILNNRYLGGRPTIISSESTLSQLMDIDGAVAGRIAEKAFSAGYGFSISPGVTKNYRLKGIVEL